MEFPFVIHGQKVPHIADKIFSYCDLYTLLACRDVSETFKMGADKYFLPGKCLRKAIEESRVEVV